MTTHSLTSPPAGATLSPSTYRRVGAVFAGLFAVFAVTTATDIVLHATRVYPEWGPNMSDALYGLAAAYRVAYGVLGGYVTARFAPDKPMAHAFALGLVGVALSAIGCAVMWGVGPVWYPLAVMATALPCSLAGGRLFRGRA